MLKPMEHADWNRDVAGAERALSVRWALAGLSVSTLLPSLGTSIASVALPTLAQAFDAPFQQVQWIVVAYLLAGTVLIVSVGRLGDLVGRRRLLLAGIVLFSAASLLCGVASTFWLLVAGRAAQGLGAAIMTALAMALVGQTVSKAKTGGAMGLLGTMSAAGTALGPSLGGLLIAGCGWRAMFLINLPLGVLAFLLVLRHLPADRDTTTADRGADRGADRAGFDHRGTFRLARALGAGLAMNMLVATVMMATLVVGPFYLSRALALDTALVGMILSVGPLTAALAGVPAGRLVDRFGTRRTIVGGLIGTGTGSGLLAVIPATSVSAGSISAASGVAGYIGPIILVTAGYALFQAANNTAVMTGVAADRRGVVSGMLSLSRNLGLITGASAFGALFAFASGTMDVAAAPPEAVAGGMRITFAVATGLIALALAVAIGRRVPSRHDVRPQE